MFRGRVFKGRRDTSNETEVKHPSYENEYELYTEPCSSMAEASVVTSSVGSNRHMPVLDLDIEHYLIPSSTPGHAHLYLNTECSWDDYVEFLKAAAKCGIIEQGYADVSIRKGYTAVRLPWVQRETPR